jgi:1,4-alpha-glucan branching enzyme
VILVPALRSGLSEPSADSAPVGDAVTGGEGTTVFVQFRLDAPEASEVRLAGSFTGWEPRHALHRAEDGVWTVMVALEPGIHDYAFVVDGSTTGGSIPSAPRVDDGFGGENSRLALLLENGMRES